MTIDRPWWLDGSSLIVTPPSPPPGGGGKKSGGSKGKGKGGDNWTGGKGWGGGGKKGLTYPVMNRNVVSVWKNAQSGIVNDPIDTWTTAFVNDGGAFDLPTGVYTAPVTGYYLVSWQGNDDGLASNGVATAPIRLRKNGTTTISETYAAVGGGASTPTHEHSSGRTRIVQLDASDTLELLQINDESEQITLTIIGIYSAYWFEATKATGAGTGSGLEDIDTYDAVTEYDSNYSAAFSTSTGVFTAPVTGPYYLFAGGGKRLVTGSSDMRLKVTRVAGDLTVVNENFYGGTGTKTGDNFNPMGEVVYLAAGDTAELQQSNKIMDEVVFGGMLIHESANWFALNDHNGGDSTLTTNGHYAGFANREGSDIGTDWNDTTGTFSVPSGAQSVWFMAGLARVDGVDTTVFDSAVRKVTTNIGYGKSTTSDAAALSQVRSIFTSGATSLTPGTDTLNLYMGSSIASDTMRNGHFSGFEPWGADL